MMHFTTAEDAEDAEDNPIKNKAHVLMRGEEAFVHHLIWPLRAVIFARLIATLLSYV